MRHLWQRIHCWAAWLLLPLMLLQFLSGYAMLHWRLSEGILSRPTAFRVRTAIQPLTVTEPVAHGLLWVRHALAKRTIASRWLDGALTDFRASLIEFASYVTIRR